jgi:hypothetical protein
MQMKIERLVYCSEDSDPFVLGNCHPWLLAVNTCENQFPHKHPRLTSQSTVLPEKTAAARAVQKLSSYGSQPSQMKSFYNSTEYEISEASVAK